MAGRRRSKAVAVLLCIAAALFEGAAFPADEITLELKPKGTTNVIEWRSRVHLPISAMTVQYRIERSTTLDTNAATWQTIAGPIEGAVGVSDELLRKGVPASGDYAFYRIVAERRFAPPGNFGAAVYGYASEFSRELQQLGQMPLEAFVQRYQLTNEYLTSVSFDLASALFWDAFNLDPAIHNATNPTDPRLTDFRLNPEEFAVFQTNGFVVSPRLGSYSFADAFYKVYTDDLPVFISADAIVHAWHRSYITMLEEIEETFLAPRLEQIIRNMRAQIPGLWSSTGFAALADGIADADFFLAVAASLVTATNHSGMLGQSARISAALSAINTLSVYEGEIFGAARTNDFSQFRVRGHYETSLRLSNYFRAMMWCGLVDFRFTGATNDNSLRELSGTIAMNFLLDRAGERTNWLEFERVLQTFVGLGDALDFAQLGDLLIAANVRSPSDVPDAGSLHSLHAQIMAGDIGVQNIRNGYLPAPISREQLKLPRSFAVMPQRFVLDSWAFTKVTFDDIIWDEDGVADFSDKVPRRVPGALDIAFAVFGNDHTVPDIAARITNTNGHPWRDGKPYQHNLAAVRNVIDTQTGDYWTNSIYGQWLNCLRALSGSTTDFKVYPQIMRTRAWAMKTLNTQLASWTQLRHDTVLYAKQSYTPPIICGYPAGFVEPRVEFWQALAQMAVRTKSLLANLPTNGTVTIQDTNYPGQQFSVSLQSLHTNRLALFDNFVSAASMLRTISEKQLTHVALTTNEASFLQDVVERQSAYVSGGRKFTGWYPSLFYRSARQGYIDWGAFQGSDIWDPLVTDVHTDTPDAFHGDPGSVLHQAVGNVHMAFIVADCGEAELTMFAGPVLSHYEFELGPTTRKTDSEWKADIKAGRFPPHPEWTRSYLVPGSYTLPPGL